MTISISVLRKRWLALAAVLILVAIALTTGTLLAANEQHPENPTVVQQSVADAAHPEPAADLPVAPPAPERVFAQPADNDEVETDLPPIVKVPPAYPNLDSNLNRLAEQAQVAGQQSDTTGGSDQGSAAPAAEPVLVTFYIEPDQVSAVRQFLEDNDVFIRNVGEDYIEAHVPPTLLPAASERPGVLRVDTVIPPEPDQGSGRAVSQGVALHQANAWHGMGYRGQGIKVGVIDTGFSGFSQRLGSELPRSVMVRCYSDPDVPAPVSSSLADCEVGSVHGTAVAETIIDVAPEVQLYIANPRTFGDLGDAVNWMVSNEVNVINHSVSWTFQGPGDGTSPFSSSALNSVDAAVAGTVVWVNSGGNSARNTWYGTFVDPDRDNQHNFASRDIGNTFYLPYVEGDRGASRVTAFMRWDDSWGGANCDLDLLLVRSIPGPNNDILIAQDDIIQDGGINDIPFALVWVEAISIFGEGYYYLVITKHTCSDDPDWIQLTARSDDALQYYSPGHHIGNPAESRNPGMMAVGAAHWGSPQAIASYSSRGPTIDGRIKPDITGIACATSTVYENTVADGTECWFAGTSQAAPHVAGLAALVRQRFPNYTPEQVTAYLKKHADERSSLGADNTWGDGLATLPVPSFKPERRGAPPTSNIEIRPGENPDEVVISWEPVPEATHYRIGYVNMEVDVNLAIQASCTMEEDDWIQAFVYVDVKAPNVPIRNGRAEYTIRRLSEGAAHTFTVLTSNNLYTNRVNVGAEFSWTQVPSRWVRLDGRRDLPPGVVIPQLDCP